MKINEKNKKYNDNHGVYFICIIRDVGWARERFGDERCRFNRSGSVVIARVKNSKEGGLMPIHLMTEVTSVLVANYKS